VYAPPCLSLSEDQIDALEEIESTIADQFSQICVIHGLAGSGKTYTLAEAARRYPSSKIVAPTNKAADVLRRRIGRSTSTIHGLFYRWEGEVVDKETGRKRLIFEKIQPRGALIDKIVLLDEGSMVAADIAHDLIESGAKLIVFGDPGQLPPINGETFFDEPDVLLRHIHRQAAESAIIRQAHQVRSGRGYQNDGPDFRVERVARNQDILDCDVVLCHTRDTRHQINRRKRRLLERFGDYPCRDDLILSHVNRPNLGIWNGGIYRTIVSNPNRKTIIIEVDGHEIEVNGCHFGEVDDPKGYAATFSFAYALTVHKAQGSEWDHVLIIDEYFQSDGRREWLYTAITRASQSVLMVKNL
jgi:exodeoxyribonuclease V